MSGCSVFAVMSTYLIALGFIGDPTAPVGQGLPSRPEKKTDPVQKKLSVDSISAVDIGNQMHFVSLAWDVNAQNPSSGAYGIPQELPGSKMAAFGGDWASNPATQIAWGLDYIADVYGTPCGAWGTFQSQGWY